MNAATPVAAPFKIGNLPRATSSASRGAISPATR